MNNTYAQFSLGLIYYKGQHVERNITKAIYFLSLAADQYHSDAQFILGSIYYEGIHVAYEIEKAIHYFKEASNFNNQFAKNNLGVIYKTGKGVKASISRAIEYFEEAIRQEQNKVAMFNLAHIYFYEEAGFSNLQRAFELLIEPSLHGIWYSHDLLCLVVIKKYPTFNISEIQADFEKADSEKGEILSESTINQIKFYQSKSILFFSQLYNKLKDINLVYYGEKIENQTEKKKIELIDNRTVINALFYEGLGDIN